MPIPSTHTGTGAAGRSSPWWVVQKAVPGGRAEGVIPTQARSRPSGTLAGPFSSANAAQSWITNKWKHAPFPNPVKAITGWFGGLGGMIGSGIEAGFIQSIKDIWDVILGPLEVVIGFIIAAFVLVVYFRDDITSMVGMIGMAAAA